MSKKIPSRLSNSLDEEDPTQEKLPLSENEEEKDVLWEDLEKKQNSESSGFEEGMTIMEFLGQEPKVEEIAKK